MDHVWGFKYQLYNTKPLYFVALSKGHFLYNELSFKKTIAA